jgi:hypothetical protein
MESKKNVTYEEAVNNIVGGILRYDIIWLYHMVVDHLILSYDICQNLVQLYARTPIRTCQKQMIVSYDCDHNHMVQLFAQKYTSTCRPVFHETINSFSIFLESVRISFILQMFQELYTQV